MKMSRPDMTGSLAHKFSSKYNPSATIFARFTGVLLVRAIPARVGTPASCFPCDDCSWSVPPPAAIPPARQTTATFRRLQPTGLLNEDKALFYKAQLRRYTLNRLDA